MEDPYWRLRPPPPTPTDELCACGTDAPWVLTASFVPLNGSNPLRCLRCNGEIPLERLSLPTTLIEPIAHWQWVHGAIESLELDSGTYEAWARSQLLDPTSASNVEGVDLTRDVNRIHPCYFWFFQPDTDEDFEPRSTCPVCSGPLTRPNDARSGLLVCDADRIVLSIGIDTPGS